MKTWTNQAPIDEDFNRLENAIEDIKDKPLSFVGTHSIEAFNTDTIESYSSDVSIEGCNFTEKLKGITFYNSGFLTPYTMSATSENARRATVIDAGLVDYYHSRNDDVRIIQAGISDQYPIGIHGVFTNYSNYDANGQVIIVEYNSGIGYSKANILIENITLSTSQSVSIDSVGLSAGQYRKNYYNMGIGVIKITISEQTSRSLWEPAVFVRRCRYPIAENDPVKVLNADYTSYEQRQITEADFTSFKIS